MSAAARVVIARTSLSVSRLCLGGNRFGGELGQEASFALLDAFVAAGGNFIDTAHVYADWVPGNEKCSSEKMIGRWLRARRPADIVIATKGGHPALSDPDVPRLDAASLRRDVTEGLSYLGVPKLDLFYVHRDDPSRPVEDILGTLEAMRTEGLLTHYGASNWRAERLAAAEAAAAARGWQGFTANQSEWNLALRNPGSSSGGAQVMDKAMVALHVRTGLAAMPYSAQAKGYFDKSEHRPGDPATGSYDNSENRSRAAAIARIAARHAATPTQVMLAALILAPFTTIPIVGCRTAAQIDTSFSALSVVLAPDEAALLLGWAGL